MSDQDPTTAVMRQADQMADIVLAAAEPDIRAYKAIHGLIRFARDSGLFEPSPRHLAALDRSPPAMDMATWAARDPEGVR